MKLKRKHIILITLLIFLVKNHGFSQERFCVPTKGLIGHNVIEYDSSYLAINVGKEVSSSLRLFFNKINKKGDSINFWDFKLDTNYGSHSWFQDTYTSLNGENYIFGRTLDTNIKRIKGVLTKFNQDYTQRNNFFNFFYEEYTSLDHIVSKDTTFLVTAQIFKSNDETYGSLIEIDTNGNVLWKKDFRDNRHLWNFELGAITPTPDKGFLINGTRFSNKYNYGQDDVDSLYTYLIKVDSVGNEEWKVKIGPDSTRNICSNAILTSDSNYLVTWTDNENDGYTKNNKVRYYKSIYVTKISKYGIIIWQKNLENFLNLSDTAIPYRYHEFYPYNISQLRKTKDGNIVIIGNTVLEGFMLKMDEEANPLWNRKYYPTMIPEMSRYYYSDNGITGMIETKDNGFLLTGYHTNRAGQVPYFGLQSGMLYKTDKYGCLTEGCYKNDKWYTDSVQKVEDSIAKENQRIQDSIADALNKSNKSENIMLFPNPSNGEVTVKIPASYNFAEPIEVFVFTSYGKLVKTFKLTDYTTKLILEDLYNGLYLFRFSYGDVLENKKIVFY